MPRKKILGPATSRQVLEYFNQADLAAVEVVFDLVGAVMEARRAEESPTATGPALARPKRRGPNKAKAGQVAEPSGD